MATRKTRDLSVQQGIDLAEERKRIEDEIRDTALAVKASEIRSSRAEVIGFEEKGQQSLYAMLAKCVGFVRLSKTEEGKQVFDAMCKTAAINNRNNEDINRNEYIPHMRLLFGEERGRLNAATYKWCQAIRYMIENSVDEPEAVQYINEFAFNKKTKLAGLVSADSAAHPTNRGSNSSLDFRLYKVRKEVKDYEIGKIETEEEPETADGLCLVLGEAQRDGKVVLRKFYSGDDLAMLITKFLPKKEKKSIIQEIAEAD